MAVLLVFARLPSVSGACACCGLKPGRTDLEAGAGTTKMGMAVGTGSGLSLSFFPEWWTVLDSLFRFSTVSLVFSRPPLFPGGPC